MGIFQRISTTINKVIDNRTQVKLAKVEAKDNKVVARVEGRTAQKEMKYEAQAVAYQNGIDPNAAKWQGIATLGESAAGATSSILGNGVTTSSFGSGAGSNTMILVVFGLVIAFFMFFKGGK